MSLIKNSSCPFYHRNRNLQTSVDVSHSNMNEIQECSKEEPHLAGASDVKDAPLTNGHTHIVNGALNSEDLSPVTNQPFLINSLSKCRVRSSPDKPQSPSVQFQAKPDPYEFPQSPPKQSDQSLVLVQQSSSQRANEKRLKPPPPTYQEAIKATESHLFPKQLQAPLQVDMISEKTLSPASRSLSHSPVRLNGSHHNAFTSDSASLSTNNVTFKSEPPMDESSSSSSKSSAQLLEHTGSLISEFYSHSRLHQISTWRSGFSEYVNELHSKRKGAGGASLPGKERLRKSAAQRSIDTKGRKGRVAVFVFCTFLRASFLYVA